MQHLILPASRLVSHMAWWCLNHIRPLVCHVTVMQ